MTYPGSGDNAWGLPHYTQPEEQKDKEILAAMSPPPRIIGVTIASGQGKLPSGTILSQFHKTNNSVPAASRGKFGRFLDSASGATTGLDRPFGVLRTHVDASSSDRAGEMIMFGCLKIDQLENHDDGTIAEAIAKTSAGNPFRYALQNAHFNEIIIG